MQKKKSRLTQVLEIFERDLIISTMRNHGWSRKKTAKELGIPMSTLKYKMTKLGIYGVVPRRKKVTPKGLHGNS